MESHSGYIAGGLDLKNKQLRIIVCDNSVETGIMYTRYLCSMGCEAVYLHSGSENIFSRLSEISPDAVLLSIPSRKICTAEICSYIHENLPHTKIILLSYVSFSEMNNTTETGADLCILMPSTPNEVYRAIVKITGSNTNSISTC